MQEWFQPGTFRCAFEAKEYLPVCFLCTFSFTVVKSFMSKCVVFFVKEEEIGWMRYTNSERRGARGEAAARKALPALLRFSWCIRRPVATAQGSTIPMWTQRISSGTLSLVRRENSCAQCILSLWLCANHETRIWCDDDENEFRAEAYEFDAPVLSAIRYYFLCSLFFLFSLLMVSTRSCDRHAHMANHKMEKRKEEKALNPMT